MSEKKNFIMSKRHLESLMRRILDGKTKGVFSDSHWKPIHDIQKEFELEGIDMTLNKAQYYQNKGSSSAYDGKEYVFEVPYGEKGGWILRLLASFGPSPLSDPTSLYDVIYTLSWDGRMKQTASTKTALLQLHYSLGCSTST